MFLKLHRALEHRKKSAFGPLKSAPKASRRFQSRLPQKIHVPLDDPRELTGCILQSTRQLEFRRRLSICASERISRRRLKAKKDALSLNKAQPQPSLRR